MFRKASLFCFVALILALAIPATPHATLVNYFNYSVSGTARIGEFPEWQLINMNGYMILANEGRVHGNYYIYDIAMFELSVGENAFSGTGQVRYLTWANETLWILWGTGDWSIWYGDMLNIPSFYHADGTAYTTPEYTHIAPILYLSNIDAEPDTISMHYLHSPSSGLHLTRTDAPVPEPATILLLGSGLVGLLGFRKKFGKR